MRLGRNKFTELVTLSSFTTEGKMEEEERVMRGSKDRQGVHLYTDTNSWIISAKICSKDN